MDRYAEVTRKTDETDIVVKLDLDGSGVCDISTGVPFFDHMLNAFGRHGLFDLIKAIICSAVCSTPRTLLFTVSW